MRRSPITTHVLDTASGHPASGVPVNLCIRDGDEAWTSLAEGITNDDGRVADLLTADHELKPAVYRMRFGTGEYFKRCGVDGFYPYADIVFQVREVDVHYHIPLLLSPFGYSTYRGS